MNNFNLDSTCTAQILAQQGPDNGNPGVEKTNGTNT